MNITIFSSFFYMLNYNNNYKVFKLDNDTVYFEGPINSHSVNSYLKIAHDSKSIMINSVGGNIAEAIKMGTFIHENKINVDVAQKCISACAQIILISANEKFISNGSFIYYHSSPFDFLPFANDKSLNQTQIVNYNKALKIYSDYYKKIGVSNELSKCVAKFRNPSKFDWKTNNIEDLKVLTNEYLIAVDKEILEYYGVRNIKLYKRPENFNKNYDGFFYYSDKNPKSKTIYLNKEYCIKNYPKT